MAEQTAAGAVGAVLVLQCITMRDEVSAMATTLISLRLDPTTLERLDAHGRETGESRSCLARRLIEEGLRMEAHPGIVFRPGPAGRRAALVHGPDVWEIVPVVNAVRARGGDVINEAAKLTGCTPQEIQAVVRYYAEYPEEVDERIARNTELAERREATWRREQELLGR